MRYVVDSSLAVKWVIAEADSAKALHLRDDFSHGLKVLRHLGQARMAQA